MASNPDLISGDGNGMDRRKKPVWKVPSNGSIEVGPVIDTASWPALSESATKASPKSSTTSSSSDSLKSLSDSSASVTPGPLVTVPPAKLNTVNSNVNPSVNPAAPIRQKSMKRGGGGGSGGGGNSSSVPPNGVMPVSPLAPVVLTEMSQISEHSPRGVPNKHGDHGAKSGGISPLGPDQHRGHGSGRRGNNGGGNHQNNYRRNQEWSHHPNYYMQQQQQRGGGFRTYPRPPAPVSAPFAGPPPPVRPFVNPMGYPGDMASTVVYVTSHPPPETLRGLSFAAPPALFFPALDPQRALLLKQIDYYFSPENLCRDVYLRHNMDEQGWVHVSLIAGFNRVKRYTNNIQYILDTVCFSTVVEVKGEKIRKRNDWMNWLLQPSNNNSSGSGSSLTTEDYDAVAARLQTVGIDGTTAYHNNMRGLIPTDVVFTRSASGNLNSQFHVVGDPTVEGNGQFTAFSDSDQSKSMRSLVRSDTL